MLTLPRISVVIPVYNAASYLADCLDSVFSQDVGPLEVVVVDDGSSDGSAAVAARYPAVRLLRQANAGISAARNAGLRVAHGDWLAFLDADDLWMPGKLRRQAEILTIEPRVAAVSGRVEQFYQPGYTSALAAKPPASDAPLAGSSLFRRQEFLRVGLFNEQLRLGEFLDWHARSRTVGMVWRHVPEVVLRRRIHGTNTGVLQRGARQDYASALRAHLIRQRAGLTPHLAARAA